MKYISEFEIKNFRVFDYLKLEDLGKINVFFGKNNSGKSSILEAILLLGHDFNKLEAKDLNLGIRNLELKYLFHDLNINNQIEIKINKEYIFNFKLRYIGDDSKGVILDIENYGKKYLYIESYSNILRSSVLASYSNILALYKDIIMKRRGDLLLEFLRKFDNRIEDVQLLEKLIYFGVKNIDELLPINLMGDGIKYIFNILVSIISGHDFVLIDEIENGLHYTAHKELWVSIMKLQEEFDFQMFITTHSLETLKALKEVLEDEKNKEMRGEVKSINIVHTKKAGIKTYNYGFESFKEMIDTETEIR